MATVIKRGTMLHIAYYDPSKGKTTTKSLGLEATEANMKKAHRIAKQFQDELTKKNKKLKEIGIKKVTIKDAFNHFLKINEGKHEKTKYEYRAFYKRFTSYFNEDDPCTVVTKLSIEDWLSEIKKLPMQKNSIHVLGKQCMHFLGFLFEYNYTPMFKVNKEVKTKPEIKEKIVFAETDIQKIFNGLKDKNSNFKTLINLAFYTGLRSSDLIGILSEKINLDKMELSYYSPKSRKFREIPLHLDLKPILEENIKEVPKGKLLDYSSTENLGRAVERYFIALKIKDKGYSARTFRKTFITLARSYGMDAAVVRELVGHEHTTTADRYYNKIQMETMKKELEKFKRPVSE